MSYNQNQPMQSVPAPSQYNLGPNLGGGTYDPIQQQQQQQQQQPQQAQPQGWNAAPPSAPISTMAPATSIPLQPMGASVQPAAGPAHTDNDKLLKYFLDKDAEQERVNSIGKQEALNQILATKGRSYSHIVFYNCIVEADSLAEGVSDALCEQKDMYDQLVNFNALVAGFTFIGLPLGQQPETSLQVVTFFVLIVGFLANVVGALLGSVATLHIGGLKHESWECVWTNFVSRWSKWFFIVNYISILGILCLAAGVNIAVYDIFTDAYTYPCERISADESEWCGPPSDALAPILNGITFIGVTLLLYVLFGSVLMPQKSRKLFTKEGLNQ